MKWAILILLILGFVAAACAAVLVGVVQLNPFASSDGDASPGVEVVVAKQAMPAMTVMDGDDFDKLTVARADLPVGRLINATAALGRVLAVSVVKGQILKEADFVWEGTGAHLAAYLPEGMRAFTIYLNRAADRVILYPGCVVDVLFSAKLSGSEQKGQAIAATILRGIQVLSVAGDSVVSSPTLGQSKIQASSSGGLSVTLLVDPKQAEALQLASDNGIISLSVRNPLDKNLGDMEATVLNQGQLANLSSVFTPEILAAAQKYKEEGQTGGLSQRAGAGEPNKRGPMGPNGQAASPSTGTPVQPAQPQPDNGARKSRPWEVTVIRGHQTAVEEVSASKTEMPNK
jgi:Flp pilus assembly protein CpaB